MVLAVLAGCMAAAGVIVAVASRRLSTPARRGVFLWLGIGLCGPLLLGLGNLLVGEDLSRVSGPDRPAARRAIEGAPGCGSDWAFARPIVVEFTRDKLSYVCEWTVLGPRWSGTAVCVEGSWFSTSGLLGGGRAWGTC